MAVFGVEIDQIDEDKPAVGRRLQCGDEQIDVAVVALALALLSRVAMGENVADLADRDNGAPGLRGALQQVSVGRRHREILAVGGAGEVFCASADERTRDHTSDMERVAEPPPDAAKVV